MRFNIFSKILSIYLFFLCVFWFLLYQTDLQVSFWNYFYSFVFSLIPLMGGLIGIRISITWGSLRSAIGRAIFYISIGLFSWGIGSMIWSYYNFFLKISVPYPSFADIGFIAAVPLWMMGMFNLSYATGAKFNLKKNIGKFFLILIPVIVIIFSYCFLVTIARQGKLIDTVDSYQKMFFDLAYPLGDVLILTVTLLLFGLSYTYLGGKYKIPILSILIGFTAMYFADFVFSYTTTIGTFYNGNWGDMLFTIALFLITFGILGFYKEEFHSHK